MQIKSCLIDDDFVHKFGMKKIIWRYQPTAEIVEFSNGLDALNFFKSYNSDDELPELIFIDINMPIMNGWQFVEEFIKIKANISKNITLYVLSSSNDSVDIQRARSNPAIADYFIKPMKPELLKKIFLNDR